MHLARALVVSAVLLVAAPAAAQPAQGAPGADVTPPVVVTHVDAEYPPGALARRAHGDVSLDVTVDVDGHVSKVDVHATDAPEFSEAATVAVRQWTFVPAKRDGRPVPSRIRVPFHFAPPAPPPDLVGPPPGSPPALAPHTATQPAPAPAPAPAPQPAPNPAPNPATGGGVEEVRVIGRASPPSRGGSDFHTPVGELANVPHPNASSLLELGAPGLVLTNEGGPGHAEGIFLRGFAANEGESFELSVNGVPINESGNLHTNGYADTHFIIPELVESLRVVEGPYDPRQGDYAIAGSADYQLGLARRGLGAKYTYGSFGTHRMLLTWGPREEDKHTFGAAEIGQTDGFGQDRDARTASAMGQYEGRFGDTGSWRVFAQGYATQFHTPGVVREDDYESGRMGFYDSYDAKPFASEAKAQGGDMSRYSVSGDLETRVGTTLFTQQAFAIDRGFRLRENFTGFLDDPPAQRGDMLDLAIHESTIGARGAARMHGLALGQKQELELGYYAREDFVHATQDRLQAKDGAPYLKENDLQSQLGDIALYADANVKPLHWLTVRGGVRGDLFTYDVLNELSGARASASNLAAMPRASILTGPFAGFTLHVSYGEGVRSLDPADVVQDDKSPLARVEAYETGATWLREMGDTTLSVRSIFFRTNVDRDVRFDETQGRDVVGVGTGRTGWTGATRLTGEFFDESASLTLVRAIYDDTHLEVAYVPATVLRSDTALFTDLPFTIDGERPKGALGVGLTYYGARPLPYGLSAEPVFTADANARVEWSHYELGLMLTNLFDAKYRLAEFAYPSDFRSFAPASPAPVRHFNAGAPRSVFGTFAIHFSGP